MFGTYRTLLAVLVVAQHLGGAHVLGAYAVFGFYVLSGYLMTSILHINYGYSVAGIGRYALNRFLRIYPMYWISIFGSLLLIVVLGNDYVIGYHEAMFIPRNTYEYFKNIFLFFPVVESPRLTPAAWALTIELCFYILIGLGLSRNKYLTIAWLIASVIYHACANIYNWGWDNIYFSIPAASLPFATGAFVFHFKDIVRDNYRPKIKKVAGFLPIILFLFMIFNWWLGDLTGYSRSLCFYVNYFVCSLMVLLLSQSTSLLFISSKIDKWIGNLSYPMYVIHYQTGLMVMAFLHNAGLIYKRPDIYIFLFSLPIIILIAWLLVVCVEQPLERVRTRVRPISND